jgi:Zn-dependent protease/CBS domain-containing protein
MSSNRIHLFRLYGFPINIDPSWFIVLALVTWSLATGFFPAVAPAITGPQLWVMGLAGALLLFVSIVLHEFAHAWVARREGLPMRGITLFIFGGVAEMSDEPPSASAELKIAIAGPAMSLLIGLVCLGLRFASVGLGLPQQITAILEYLYGINFTLILFNLIPAFPLDGGRVLRALLWRKRGDITSATRTSSRIGATFGLLLMALGAWALFSGNPIGGVWYLLIGMFVQNAANASYQQVLIRHFLQGEPVGRLMRTDVVSVPPRITVDDLVRDFFYRYHFRMFPVTQEGQLLGCVSAQRVRDLPQQDWAAHYASDIMEPCTVENTIAPGDDAIAALKRMSEARTSHLMVTEAGRLLGLITAKDLTNLLSRKMEIEGRR